MSGGTWAGSFSWAFILKVSPTVVLRGGRSFGLGRLLWGVGNFVGYLVNFYYVFTTYRDVIELSTTIATYGLYGFAGWVAYIYTLYGDIFATDNARNGLPAIGAYRGGGNVVVFNFGDVDRFPRVIDENAIGFDGNGLGVAGVGQDLWGVICFTTYGLTFNFFRWALNFLWFIRGDRDALYGFVYVLYLWDAYNITYGLGIVVGCVGCTLSYCNFGASCTYNGTKFERGVRGASFYDVIGINASTGLCKDVTYHGGTCGFTMFLARGHRDARFFDFVGKRFLVRGKGNVWGYNIGGTFGHRGLIDDWDARVYGIGTCYLFISGLAYLLGIDAWGQTWTYLRGIDNYIIATGDASFFIVGLCQGNVAGQGDTFCGRARINGCAT